MLREKSFCNRTNRMITFFFLKGGYILIQLHMYTYTHVACTWTRCPKITSYFLEIGLRRIWNGVGRMILYFFCILLYNWNSSVETWNVFAIITITESVNTEKYSGFTKLFYSVRFIRRKQLNECTKSRKKNRRNIREQQREKFLFQQPEHISLSWDKIN